MIQNSNAFKPPEELLIVAIWLIWLPTAAKFPEVRQNKVKKSAQALCLKPQIFRAKKTNSHMHIACTGLRVSVHVNL